jgi:ubiquinone/menaquinone biosynthesis C-methylase UbiE
VTISLLPRQALLKTGDVDHAAWNYDGVLGYVSRRRFALVRSLLSRRRAGKLLEVGYGSGVFFPELAKHADRLYGADIHDRPVDVTAVLAKIGIPVELATAPAEALPYPDEMFDVVVAVVAVSTLEFVPDLRKAVNELARVLAPGGRVIVVTPGRSPLLDLALRIFTGESAAKDFGDRRERIVPTLTSEMKLDRSTYFPFRFPIPIYRALRLVKRDERGPGPAGSSSLKI